MEDRIDRLLLNLDDELERKCCELRLQKRERAFRKLFFFACALFLMLPFLLIFAGINLVTVCVPFAIFLSISLMLLLPVVLGGEQGGISP